VAGLSETEKQHWNDRAKVSGWNLFAKTNYPSLKDNPRFPTSGDRFHELGRMWRALSPAEQDEW